MPPAYRYILPGDREGQSTEARALDQAYLAELRERTRVYKRHWDFYYGNMPRPLKIELDGVDDNVLLPKVDQVADKIVAFLLGEGIRFDVGGDDEETAADLGVDALWSANRQAILCQSLALSGALSGHCFVRLEPREGQPTRIVNLNPAHCAAFWDPDDVERVLWYRLQYQMNATGPGKRVDYVREVALDDAGQEDAWYELVYRSERGQEWIPQGQPQRLAWPFPPVVDWQNLPRPHAYYGQDDVGKAVALNGALNFVASDVNRILKHHGHPKTIGLGLEAADVVGTAIGGFFTSPKGPSEASIFNLEMQSDLSAAMSFLGLIGQEIWQSARMVDPQSLRDRIGALTNFGLRVLFADAIRKTETKRAIYGEAFAQISKRALVMAGQAAPEVVRVVWPDALPADEAALVEGVTKELDAGLIDKESGRERLGYDNDLIEKRLANERAGQETLGSQLLTAFARGG